MSIIADIHNDLEKGAFRLMVEYRARLYAEAVKLCQDAVQAEDLVFRTFEKVLSNSDGFQDGTNLFAWMKTIMTNLHRNDAKRPVNRGTKVVDACEIEQYVGADWTTDEEILRNSDSEVLRAAIRTLGPIYQDPMLMRYYDGLSLREIASILRLPMGTVSRRLHVAHRLLAGKLSAEFGRAKKSLVVIISVLLFIGVAFASWSTGLFGLLPERATAIATAVSQAETDQCTARLSKAIISTNSELRNAVTEERQMNINGNAMAAALSAAVVTLGASASNFYWRGGGEDAYWTTVENWSSSADGTADVERVPGSGDEVYFRPSLYPNHETTVLIAEEVTCGNIHFRDGVSSGRITLKGVGNARVPITIGEVRLNDSESKAGCGVIAAFENLTISRNGAFCVAYSTASDGNGWMLDNCELAMGDSLALTLPYGPNALVVIRDSELNFGALTRKVSTSFTLAVTNSTLTGHDDVKLLGVDSNISFYESTLAFAAAAGSLNLGGQNDSEGVTYARADVRFVKSTLDFGDTPRLVYASSDHGTFLLDEVTTKGQVQFYQTHPTQAMTVRNTDVRLGRSWSFAGTLTLDNSEWVVTADYGYTQASADGTHYIIRGKRSRLMPGGSWKNGKVDIDFVVPVGGYDRPPVGCDGQLTKFNGNFFNGVSGGSIRVLPESPAACVSETGVYPLIYVYTGRAFKQVNFAAVTPQGLPNENSQFLVTSNSDLPFDDVTSQAEDWWTPIEPGYTTAEAGLAVKIVGVDARLPVIASLRHVLTSSAGLGFEMNLASIGGTADGGKATTAAVTLLIRKAGSEMWTEVAQEPVTKEGVFTLNAAKSYFTEGGDYEYGVRVVNDLDAATAELFASESIPVNFLKPAVSGLTVIGEGVEASVSGKVTSTGAGEMASVTLEVSESEDFSTGVARYELGDFGVDADFTRTVAVNPGLLTYFRVTASSGGYSASSTASTVSRTVATIGDVTAVNTNGFCVVTVDGTVTSRGAGVSTVKMRWSVDGTAWTTNEIGTVSEDGGAFRGIHPYPMPDGVAYYEVLVENSSGGQTWVAAGGVQTIAVINRSTFFWRAVDGEWNGNWSDGRHWYKPDFPEDETLYPDGSLVKADFNDCPADGSTTTITVDRSVAVNDIQSSTAGQKLAFAGSTATTLAVTKSESTLLNQDNGVNTFEGITLSADSLTVAPKAGCVWRLTGGASATVLLFGSNSFDSILYVGAGCTMTIRGAGADGGGKLFEVDDGTLNIAGFFWGGNASGTVDFLVKGKKGKVVFTSPTVRINNAWKRVRFTFEVPEGGYDEVPVSFGGTSKNMFLVFNNAKTTLGSSFCQEGSDNGLIFEVAANSPALLARQSKAINNDLFCWNDMGWAFDLVNADTTQRYDLHNYTKLVAPDRTSKGKTVKTLSMAIRGLDEVSYPDAASLRAADTIAYAVPICINRSANGLIFIMR